MINAKELLEQIKEKRAEAKIPLSDIDPKLRPGAEGRIRNAAFDVRDLERKYKENIIQNSVIIAVKGSHSKEFADISQSLNAIPVDYMLVVKRIYENVRKRGGRDFYGQNEHWMVMDELNRLKVDYGIPYLKPLTVAYNVVGFEQPLLKTLVKLIESQYGGSLYSMISKKEIGNQALEKEFSGNLLPIVLYNYTVDADPMNLPPPTKVLEVNDTMTQEEVKKELLKVRNSLKKTKNPGDQNEQQQQ